MKWAVLGAKENDVQFKELSEELKSSGLDNEVAFLNPPVDSVLMELENIVAKFHQIRVLPPYASLVPAFQNRSSSTSNLLYSADALVNKGSKEFWPESYLYQAFSMEFVSHVKNLDLNSSCLVVGSGAAARAIIGALIKFGFSKFYITARSEEGAKLTIEKMKRHFFNIEFTFVLQRSIMLLPGTCSVLVNATPLVPDNQLLKDLYYFNFLKPSGLVIDTNLVPLAPPLIEEAKNIGAPVLCGFELAAHTDVLWAKDALNIDLNFQSYLDRLQKKISSIPFDITPYQLS